MKVLETEIAIVGAGGAGLSAAAAASSNGARVLLLDNNDQPGGQIWKRDVTAQTTNAVRSLLEKSKDVRFLFSSTVYDANKNSLFITGRSTETRVDFEKLIIATGAREVMLPFPGWTKPGVFTPGGLQSFVKSGFDIVGKKIVISGSGPLLIAVAEFLGNKGGELVNVFEQTSRRKLVRFGLSLLAHPRKLVAANKVGSRVIRLVKANSYVTKVFGDEFVEGVRVLENGVEKDYSCDFLATGYHLVPNMELPRLIGCETRDTHVVTDDFGQTTVSNVFCAGEPLGIAGIDAACDSGTAAGLVAAGVSADQLRPRLRQNARFRKSLAKAFELRDELRSLPDRETIVCRCEDVRFESIAGCDSQREAKLHHRVGMGNCQGRVCSTALCFLKNWKEGKVQAPLVPVDSEALIYEE